MIERERFATRRRGAAGPGRAARGDPGPLVLAGATVLLAAVPVALALSDPYLRPQPVALVVSTAAGALAVSVLVLQPLLAARATGRRRLRAHQSLGAVTLGLVLLHVGALFAVEVEHTLFSMSPDGPTRARMALIALLALVAIAALGALRTRLPMARATWRILHAYLAVVALVPGVGHAVLTDGALDGAGTPLLIGFGALGVAGVVAAHAAGGSPGRTKALP
jgi:predicted ferric reductase